MTEKIIKKKIFGNVKELEKFLHIWRFKNLKIVFTNGCFDILHRGHIEYLLEASKLGDILILGLNTDDSIRRLKGESRPIQDQKTRSILLAAYSFINAVIFFDDDTPIELIKIIRPDILVKGGDYKKEEIVGYDFVTSYGGEVIVLPYIEGYSTTEIINKISYSKK